MSLLLANRRLLNHSLASSEPLFWERTKNATNSGSGTLNFTNATVGGATASKKVSVIGGYVQFVVPSTLSNGDEVALILTDIDNTNYVWGSSGNPVKVGVYYTGTTWFKTTTSTAVGGSIAGAPPVASGQIIRIKRTSTNDLAIQLSQNGGISFSTLQTISGVVGGVNFLACKVINVIAGTSKKINISVGALLSTPEIVTLNCFTGESNAGGQGDNSDLTSSELLSRTSVQILDNTALLSFQNLQIGGNNLIGHAGLTSGTKHGWEAGLADRVEASTYSNNPTYLVKTGQGGTVIADWAVGVIYSGINSWQLMQDRVNAALTLLRSNNKNPTLFIWYSQGINDSINGTNIAVWKAATIAHFNKIRMSWPNTPILITLLPPAYAVYSTAIIDIADQYSDCYAVDVTGAGMQDANHWNASGLKLVAGNIMNTILANYNLNSGFFPAPAQAVRIVGPTDGESSVSSSNFTVSIKGVITGNVLITLSDSGNGGTFTPTTLTLTPSLQSSTFTYTPISSGNKTISVSNNAGLTNPSALTYNVSAIESLAWGDFLNASDGGGGDLLFTSTGGAFSTKRIGASGSYAQMVMPATTSNSEGVVFVISELKVIDYDWGDATNLLKVGVYYIGGNVYYIVGSTGGSAILWTTQPTIATGTILRIRKSGNDIVLEFSTDGGTSFTISDTLSGSLSGVSNPYIKVINVVSGTILKSGKGLSLI